MTYEGYTIIQVNDFITPKYELLGRKSKKERVYDCISIFDVETSWNHDIDNPQAWIYQWAWLLNDIIVVGRTKEEIIKLMHELHNVNNEGIIRTFIHNLPYEFSYLWYDWMENFTLKGDIMASAPHKPFKLSLDGFEFMCSYKVSNRSLSAWGKYYDVEHKKLDNAIDYQAIHYPTDELTETDWLYMYHDVISPKECILALMNQECMRYDQLLMTSTMYVKNEVTKRYNQDRHNYFEFKKKALTYESYNVLRKSFVGGITHANWKILNTTVKGDIRHYDFNSHYPTQMITKLFPMGKVYKYTVGGSPSIDRFLPNDNFAYWCVVDFKNLRLRDNKCITMPYISVSKCESIEHTEYIKDNGRLVECKGYCRMYLSSYDIKWILKQYTCDAYVVKESYRSRLGKLPNYLTDTILECYLNKCKLKGVEGMEVEYNKSKNILNGLYGVCATDPVRDDVVFNFGNWVSENKHSDINYINEKLEKYYKSYNKWTRYEWGTWVTSLARDELMTCIELVGYENYLYCDTDSIFFLATDNNVKSIEQLNEKWLEDSKANNYCVTDDTRTWYMHSFTEEPRLKAFRTLGAKCYAFIDIDNNFDCVIAGVPSKKTVIENGEMITYKREEELKSIDNLTLGFNFKDCVPTRAIYIDRACIIVNSKHNLSLAESMAQDYYNIDSIQ